MGEDTLIIKMVKKKYDVKEWERKQYKQLKEEFPRTEERIIEYVCKHNIQKIGEKKFLFWDKWIMQCKNCGMIITYYI